MNSLLEAMRGRLRFPCSLSLSLSASTIVVFFLGVYCYCLDSCSPASSAMTSYSAAYLTSESTGSNWQS